MKIYTEAGFDDIVVDIVLLGIIPDGVVGGGVVFALANDCITLFGNVTCVSTGY